MDKKKIKKIKAKILRVPYFIELYLFLKSLKNWPGFIKDYFLFKRDLLRRDNRFKISFGQIFPCLLDKTGNQSFEPHYLYHPAWAAKIVKQINPQRHVDISSTLAFSTILSAFVPVEFYDYRPAKIILDNLKTGTADLLHLPFADNSLESLSCLHVLEHIGLGRYGDAIDSLGDTKAAKELARAVKPGGNLMVVVPIGKAKIEFNAHRIYSYEQLLAMFSENMILKEFSLIPDNFTETGLIKNATSHEANQQNWGCGCYWFIKK